MEDDHPIDALPLEIKVNIFSRLPVESVLDCKLVCRAWRDLLQFHVNTTYFADLRLRYQYGHGLVQQQRDNPFEHCHYGSDSKTMSFVGIHTFAPRNLWYFEYHDNDESSTNKQPNSRIRKMNLKLTLDVWGLVGLDNGLICLTVRAAYNGIPDPESQCFRLSPSEPLYVCNPITREIVNLPRILIDEKKSMDGVHIVYGFGYHPLTKEYKVVRICYAGNPKKPPFKGKVEVYTLGRGSGWRNIGETNYYLCPRIKYYKEPAGVCVNGALHWPHDDSADIVAFDLADEEFHLLHVPTTQIYGRRIFVMRRCLCVEYVNSYFKELWVLKKNNEEDNSSSSSSRRHPMNEQYYKSWSWNRELRDLLAGSLKWPILSLTKRGEILVFNGGEVARCTFKQGTKLNHQK